MMEKLPFYLGLIFIAVTISRVAAFAGGNLTAWIIAIAIALGVFSLAYNLDKNGKLNKRAFTVLVFLTIVDGLFNFSETIRGSVESGRWDFAMQYGETKFHIYRIADFILGIFPTLAASGLAWVAQSLEKKPRKSASIKAQLQEGFSQYLLNMLPKPAQISSPMQIEPAQSQQEPALMPAISAFLCEECEKEFATVQALNAHKRFCANKVITNGHHK